VVVQTGAVAGGGESQTVLGSHLTATASPPLHAVLVWLWQTIPWPQSASAWQGAGWHVMDGAGSGTVFGQSAPAGHDGVGVTASALAWQVRPLAQSLSLTQVCAAAGPEMERTVTRTAIPRSDFASVMTCSFSSG